MACCSCRLLSCHVASAASSKRASTPISRAARICWCKLSGSTQHSHTCRNRRAASHLRLRAPAGPPASELWCSASISIRCLFTAARCLRSAALRSSCAPFNAAVHTSSACCACRTRSRAAANGSGTSPELASLADGPSPASAADDDPCDGLLLEPVGRPLFFGLDERLLRAEVLAGPDGTLISSGRTCCSSCCNPLPNILASGTPTRMSASRSLRYAVQARRSCHKDPSKKAPLRVRRRPFTIHGRRNLRVLGTPVSELTGKKTPVTGMVR